MVLLGQGSEQATAACSAFWFVGAIFARGRSDCSKTLSLGTEPSVVLCTLAWPVLYLFVFLLFVGSLESIRDALALTVSQWSLFRE